MGAAGMPRSVTRLGYALAATALLGLVAGCGSSKYEYVSNSSEHTYFRVPSSWQRLDDNELQRALVKGDPSSLEEASAEAGKWVVAYDAANSPSLAHLKLDAVPEAPIVLAEVKKLTTDERGKVSLDTMRDTLFPVSKDGQEQAKQVLAQQGTQYKVEILTDQVLTPSGGVHGVRTAYNVKFGDLPLQSVDLLAYVSDDGATMYSLIVRCSTACYVSNFDEIDKAVKSFTVKDSE
jgi:hypothetical protein